MMKAILDVGAAISAYLLVAVSIATAQPANLGCVSVNPAGSPQTWKCEGGVIIVAEGSARFTLLDRGGNGRVDAVELSGSALLLEVPKIPGGKSFQVITPQAIAAVRGTKWAVQVEAGKTAVFVVDGEVSVTRGAEPGVTLGPGEGVDVEVSGPLNVKRWAAARVAQLMARFAK